MFNPSISPLSVNLRHYYCRTTLSSFISTITLLGDYQIHHRPTDGIVDDQDDGQCLSKKSCKETDAHKKIDAKITKCSHCGAKGWNIMGDNNEGYVLMSNDSQSCLARIPQDGIHKDKAVLVPCDDPDTPYTPLTLQFATAADITTMASPGARLVTAASEGDKKTIQNILKQDDVSIDETDWDGLNALIPAASAGHLDLCKFLVSKGIDINAADKDGITALMEASIMGHVKIVQYLLDNGATLEQHANSGITALWLAASDGQEDIVQLLLQKGADPNNARVDDISALMSAAIGGHSGTVQLLIAAGADVTVADKDGMTPLMNAAEKGSVEVIHAILQSIPEDDRAAHVNQLSTNGFTALIITAAHGNVDAADALLDYGADTSVANQHSGVTALMYAAANKKVEFVKLLLGKGKAEVDQRHFAGGTALLEASTGGAVESMKLLIEAGANYDLKDEDGVSATMGIATSCELEGLKLVVELMKKDGKWDSELNRMSFSGGTPIMFAAAGGHAECVEYLLELGATVDTPSKATPEYLAKMEKQLAGTTPADNERHVDGVTALHVAAQGGFLECTEVLLKSGADPTWLDTENRTPLTMAIKGNFGNVAIALVKAGADPNMTYTPEDDDTPHNMLFDAIMVENEEFATVLIEKGADLTHQDDKKVTTLLQASHRGLSAIVKLLLEKKSDATYVNGASDEGVTPLIAASSEGHDDIVEMLIQAGADVNLKDGDSTTALMAAAARGHLPIVRLLVKAGASVNEQNGDGHSALMFAYNGKNQVETLMERYAQYYDDKDASGSDDDGGTGPLIQEALSNHTALVDFLLENGADTSLKDKEGHTAKDFDYQAENPAVFQKGTTTASSTDTVKEEL